MQSKFYTHCTICLSLFCSLVLSTIAHADLLPGDLIYGDTFTTTANGGESGRTVGSELGNSTPEIPSGTTSTYTGLPELWNFQTGTNDSRNTNADTGALYYDLQTNQGPSFNLGLTSGQRRFTLGMDLTPVSGTAESNPAFVGFQLVRESGDNFWAGYRNVRIGVAQEPGESTYQLLLEQRQTGDTNWISLAPNLNLDEDGWNTLRLEVDLGTQDISGEINVYLNDTLAHTWSPSERINDLDFAGVLAVIGKRNSGSTQPNRDVWVDNFAIAEIPEPGSLSLATIGGLFLLTRYRR